MTCPILPQCPVRENNTEKLNLCNFFSIEAITSKKFNGAWVTILRVVRKYFFISSKGTGDMREKPELPKRGSVSPNSRLSSASYGKSTPRVKDVAVRHWWHPSSVIPAGSVSTLLTRSNKKSRKGEESHGGHIACTKLKIFSHN